MNDFGFVQQLKKSNHLAFTKGALIIIISQRLFVVKGFFLVCLFFENSPPFELLFDELIGQDKFFFFVVSALSLCFLCREGRKFTFYDGLFLLFLQLEQYGLGQDSGKPFVLVSQVFEEGSEFKGVGIDEVLIFTSYTF